MTELQLNPKKTALVLIDLLNATVGMNTAPYAVVQVVANSKKLAETFRAAGAPVIFVNVDFNGFLKSPPTSRSKVPRGSGPDRASSTFLSIGRRRFLSLRSLCGLLPLANFLTTIR